jgi:uncharacterized protein
MHRTILVRMRWLRPLMAIAALAGCGDNELPDPAPIDAAAPPGTPADDVFEPDGHIELHVPGQPGKPRVFVYTFENFWRHASSLDCRGQVVNMFSTRGFTVTTTNDPLAINAKHLADKDVLVLCITSGSGLNARGRTDLEAWIRRGGGVVGFHSGGTMTEPFWPFFVGHIGTRFAGHVNGIFNATVRNLSSTHPITAGLPDLQMLDEWYIFTQRPETMPDSEMLFALDEDTLPADYPAMYKQGFHAIAWAREINGGRVFYAGFGHMIEVWYDPNVVELTARAIEWAAHQR